MAVTLTLVGKTPGQTQFGLDTFTEHYKCDATADIVLTDADVPQMGSAHPDYDFMFVTNRYCSETSESASALDLIYTGCLIDDGEGNPVLPAQQHQQGDAVQSASSNYGELGALSSPVTVQYYALENTLSYISYGGTGSDAADDPSGDPEVISLTSGDLNLSVGLIVDRILAQYFSPNIVHSLNSNEIVAGQFWLNVSKKTKGFLPYLVNMVPGPYVQLSIPGSGYTVGDTLTISAGGESAVVVLVAIGLSNSVIAWTVSSDTFTVPQASIVSTGGTGTGAAFNIIIVS